MNDFENILHIFTAKHVASVSFGRRKNIWLQRNVDSLSAIPKFLSVSPRGFFARKTRFPKKNMERFNSAVVLAVDSIIMHVIVIVILIISAFNIFTIMSFVSDIHSSPS